MQNLRKFRATFFFLPKCRGERCTAKAKFNTPRPKCARPRPNSTRQGTKMCIRFCIFFFCIKALANVAERVNCAFIHSFIRSLSWYTTLELERYVRDLIARTWVYFEAGFRGLVISCTVVCLLAHGLVHFERFENGLAYLHTENLSRITGGHVKPSLGLRTQSFVCLIRGSDVTWLGLAHTSPRPKQCLSK